MAHTTCPDIIVSYVICHSIPYVLATSQTLIIFLLLRVRGEYHYIQHYDTRHSDNQPNNI